MKQILLLIILSLFALDAISQVKKFRATALTLRVLNDDGNWSEWNEWEEQNTLISFNLDNNRVTIFSDPRRTFDIISSKTTIDDDGDEVLTLECLGHNENECLFMVVVDPLENVQFYINYGEVMFAYNVTPLD